MSLRHLLAAAVALEACSGGDAPANLSNLFTGHVRLTYHGLLFYPDREGRPATERRLCSSSGRLGPFADYEEGDVIRVRSVGTLLPASQTRYPGCQIDVQRFLHVRREARANST